MLSKGKLPWRICVIFISFICISGDAIELQSCSIYEHSLPIPLTNFQLTYFEELNKLFLFGGETTRNGNDAIFTTNGVYKWMTINSSSWFQNVTNNIKIPSNVLYSYINNVVIINNSLAYFIGIADDTSKGGNIYVFDAIQEKFIDLTLQNVPHPTLYGCLTTNNTHIFMVGGMYSIGSSNLLQIYDIMKDTWYSEQINITILNQGTAFQYCYLIDNILYVFGGAVDQRGDTNKIWSYDILKLVWSDIGNMTIKSERGAVAYHSRNVLLIGGSRDVGIDTLVYNTIDIFNIDEERVSNTFQLLLNVTQSSAAIVNDKLYVFGGYQVVTQTFVPVSTVQVCSLKGKDKERYTELFLLVVSFGAAGIVIAIICLRSYAKKKKDKDEAEFMIVNEQVLGK